MDGLFSPNQSDEKLCDYIWICMYMVLFCSRRRIKSGDFGKLARANQTTRGEKKPPTSHNLLHYIAGE